MLARTLCYALIGIEGEPVTVEAYVTSGEQFQFSVVGLPDAAVKESKDRVMAALKNSGFVMPYGHITINLSPADLKKEGTIFDLPIAVSIIEASKQVKNTGLSDTLLIGELGLDGSLVPVHGVLSLVIAAKEHGITRVILPEANAAEVIAVSGMHVFPTKNLQQAVMHLTGQMPLLAQAQKSYDDCLGERDETIDMAQVKGQAVAKRALEIAAAGGHNLLMIGIPGSGKTMLARCLPGILPLMTQEEAFETTRIYSACGLLPAGTGLMTTRPFRSPHHTASAAALIGGGANARPGEVSLAHNGVLFLDEMPEYPRSVLEALRQPLEDGFATVSRVRAHAQYLSACMLIASMNPCPCGYYGSKVRTCRCGSHDIRRYLDKVSGPLLDRIDLQVEIDAVSVDEITSAEPAESSSQIRERVVAARNIQKARFAGASIRCNAGMNSRQLTQYAQMTPEARSFLHEAIRKYGLSMRAYDRLIKVARTISDLNGDREILLPAIAEAVRYRMIDSKYWGDAVK